MAGLFRVSTFQSLKKGITCLQNKETIYRAIGTTPKQSETVSQDNYPTKKKVWVSFGFDKEDEEFDRHAMHVTFFVTISIGLVLGGTLLAFRPDFSLKDWAQREAYIQLRYREENGLPPIDPNLIDPARIVLPTDEELGDTEIII